MHALPPGSLPDELEDLIEELIAPGFREGLLGLYLASLPTSAEGQRFPREVGRPSTS